MKAIISTARVGAVIALGISLIACAGDPSTPPHDPQSPNVVSGKPIVQTPTGLAIANELVVGLYPAKTPSEVEALAAALGGTHVWTAPRSGYHLFRFDDAAATEAAMAALRADPGVSEVMRNRIAGGTGIGTSPDILRGFQWNLSAMGIDTTGTHGSASGITVAVLDTGIAYEDRDDATGTYVLAPAFNGTSFAAGYDFINDDPNANDDNGHGTHIAGVIGASEGIAAVAPGAALMPVKVLDAGSLGTELALAEGIYFAIDNGADVINMSLAFPPAFFPSRLLQGAVAEAAASDVVMVGAVGNDAVPVVSYPAAFRDVVAVGASRLRSGGLFRHRDDWSGADEHLRHAAYSNTGRLVDVVAPAGVIDRDLNGDGEPEATLAMSFQGDPTALDYFFFAGTSQAAAMVSGTAAVMLARNPALHSGEVTAILGETARAKSPGCPLDDDLGRGLLRTDVAIDEAAQDQSTVHRPELFVGINLILEETAGKRFGRAEVEVVDAEGRPVKGAEVFGSFTGGVYDSARKVSKTGGIAVFKSSPLPGEGNLVAFQVEAVILKKGPKRTVVRPSGFFRIDSCSLELLTAFASAAGIGTSPGPVIDPILSSPITLLMPQLSSKQIPTLLLLNFSWGLATVPMAVAVDATWFEEEFPEADELRVTTYGTGIGTSPYVMDRDTSFPITLPATVALSDDVCVDLHVRTFDAAATGIGTSPGREPLVAVNCGSSCSDYQDALGEMWVSYATGIGTSPIWSPGSGIPQSRWSHLSSMVQHYVTFGKVGDSAPVGHYYLVLDAAGLGLTPMTSGNGSNGAGTQAMTTQ